MFSLGPSILKQGANLKLKEGNGGLIIDANIRRNQTDEMMRFIAKTVCKVLFRSILYLLELSEHSLYDRLDIASIKDDDASANLVLNLFQWILILQDS